jgi:hypothetical protein
LKSKRIAYAVSLFALAFASMSFAQTIKKVEVQQIDPLKDFELIVAKCVAWNKQLESERVAFNERSNKWGKQVNSPAKISYDVKKTDSLVSPFSGSIDIENIAFVESAESEDAVKAKPISPDNSPAMSSIFNLSFAMQGGKWIATGGNSTRVLRMDGKWRQSDKMVIKMDLLSPTRPTEIRGCVP